MNSAFRFRSLNDSGFVFSDCHYGEAGEDKTVGDPLRDHFLMNENLAVQGELCRDNQPADQKPDQRGSEAFQEGRIALFPDSVPDEYALAEEEAEQLLRAN